MQIVRDERVHKTIDLSQIEVTPRWGQTVLYFA